MTDVRDTANSRPRGDDMRDDLIPLGITGDLEAGQQADFEQRLATDAGFRNEAEATERALAPLRAERDRPMPPMPARLKGRITAKILESLPAANGQLAPVLSLDRAASSRRASAQGADAPRRSITSWLRHPAAAAIIVLGLALGLLALPDPPADVQPDNPGTTPDPSANGDGDPDDGNGGNTEMVEMQPDGPMPVDLPGEGTRGFGSEAVTAVGAETEGNLPYGMRAIEGSEPAGGLRLASSSNESTSNGERPSRYRLPEGDIRPEDGGVTGNW